MNAGEEVAQAQGENEPTMGTDGRPEAQCRTRRVLFDMLKTAGFDRATLKYDERFNCVGYERLSAGLSPQERLDVWTRETGKSKAALYGRLAELDPAESHLSHLSYQSPEVPVAG